MRSKNLALIVLGISLCCTSTFAQIDFSKYLDESALPFLDLQDHLEIKFQWNMKGNVQVFMNEGINYLIEGDPNLAISNFDEVLKLDSSLWIAYYYRGICKKHLFQLDEASKDLLKSREINPKQAETYIELGEIYHAGRRLSKAAAEYEKAIELNPLLVQSYYNLGSLTLAKGDVRKGLKYYQKCNEVDPNFPQAYMMLGVLKFKAKKKNNESIALYNRAILADSMYSPTYFWKGLAHVALDQPQEGLKSWNKVVQFNPGNSFYTLMRGCLYIELGDFDNAFNDLRKAMKSREVDDERFEGAQTILDKQIDLQYAANYLITNGYGLDENAFGYVKKGFCLLLAGNKKDALDYIKKAEQIQPSATVYFLEALIYEHSGDHNSAFTYYNKTLGLDNDNFDAHKKRSVYRSELKDWKGAHEDFKELFRLQPNSPSIYRLRGLVRSSEGNYKGAIDDLTTYMKSDSADHEAIETRSVCYLYLGLEHEANEDMRRLLKFDGSWDLYETVAHNYLALKDTVSAIDVWGEFADSAPGVFIPFMELARIYVNQKNWDSARVNIDRALTRLRYEAMPKKHAEVLCWDGLVDFHHLNYTSAIAKFTKSLEQDQGNFEAKYWRAKSFEKAGELKKAASDLKSLKNARYKDSEQLYKELTKKG